jgi:gamma-glutamylcyclotransferase (GGCT)/AIG2-like uncharacterized protein YtfP
MLNEKYLGLCPDTYFPLFVYGTLQSGESNHGRFDGQVAEIVDARIGPARLWVPEHGAFPYLELAPSVKTATGQRDLGKSISMYNKATRRPPKAADLKRLMARTYKESPVPPEREWSFIEGELMLLPNDQHLLNRLDSLEGFYGTCEDHYTRSLANVIFADNSQLPAWVYHMSQHRRYEGLTFYPCSRWSQARKLTPPSRVW